uniref:F-box protein n=1 Tax=Quercus lobata TaxID=97700 RepID=A0A7N2KY44_QUELO
MNSIVVEEQEQEEGSGFVDLEPDKRVDEVTLARAACVNKLWREVARDKRLWKPLALRLCANAGGLELLCEEANPILGRSFVQRFYSRRPLITPPPSDFYSINPQVFSNRLRPWRENNRG